MEGKDCSITRLFTVGADHGRDLRLLVVELDAMNALEKFLQVRLNDGRILRLRTGKDWKK